MDTGLKSSHSLSDRGTANSSIALNVEVVTEGKDDLLNLLSKLTSRSEDEGLALLLGVVDSLENGAGEGGSLASAGLGLSNNIAKEGE